MTYIRDNTHYSFTITGLLGLAFTMSCKRMMRPSLLNYPRTREFLAEFLGTFVMMVFNDAALAQAVLSSFEKGSVFTINWSAGVGVAMGIYTAGAVTGGHLNPAVTLSQAVIGRLKWRSVPFYMMGQYLGAFTASAIVYLVYIDALYHYDGGERAVVGNTSTAMIWATYPQPYVSTANGFGDQIFGTALLLMCVMAVTDPQNMRTPSALIPISCGLIVVTIGLTFGLNCQNAVNPARDLAPRVFTAIAGWGHEPFSFRDFNWFWVPIVGPYMGAIIGVYIYQLFVGFHLTPQEKSQTQPEKKHNHTDGDLPKTVELPNCVEVHTLRESNHTETAFTARTLSADNCAISQETLSLCHKL